ncbi:MAG: hypothetical protein MSH18_03825 [Bacteroidales bacterium]|nr:hypothetical protein [Bacteroidales bacterium]
MRYIYHIRILIILFLLVGTLISCVTLLPPNVAIKKDISKYTRVYIPETQAIQSSTSFLISGVVIPYSQTTNPRDLIAGFLSKRGYIVLHQLDERFRQETIIVNYGESGKRTVGLGYTIEVTLQFVSAETGELLCTTTAEGCGDTEAGDIKQAVTRALKALLK